MTKPSVLIVSEKYCDGRPNMGWTNNFHNSFNTFQQSKPSYQLHTLHLDEAQVVYGRHIDDILPKYCLHWDINIVFFYLLGNSPLNPSGSTYDALKNLGVTLCFIWPDTGPGWATDAMQNLQGVADLHVTWDMARSDFHNNLPPLHNLLKLWTPQDRFLYEFTDYDSRVFPISFVGSRYYQQRQDTIAYLQTKLPELNVKGGQRDDKLTPYEYAWIVSHSAIMLNFPQHPLGFTQLKGRVLESMACGTLVVELKNDSTSQLFTPGTDYVEASTLDEMAEKARFYLNNPQERIKIASAGRAKYLSNYTGQHYWDAIFKRIKL